MVEETRGGYRPRDCPPSPTTPPPAPSDAGSSATSPWARRLRRFVTRGGKLVEIDAPARETR